MRLNQLFSGMLFAGILFSCSSEDVMEQQVPKTTYNYDAELSLSIANTQVVTKAGGELTDDKSASHRSNFIKKLSVAVFSAADEKLLSFKEESAPEENISVTSITNMKTISGTVKVLVLANYDLEESFKEVGKATLDMYKTIEVDLGKEASGSLTMSSDLISQALVPGVNTLGGVGKEIPMYRNVARVQLYSVEINPIDKYATDARFTFHSLFVVNVKSQSKLFNPDAGQIQGSVEMEGTGKDFWWCGESKDPGYVPRFAQMTGDLKKSEASGKNFLMYDFNYYLDKSLSDLYTDYPHLNSNLWEYDPFLPNMYPAIPVISVDEGETNLCAGGAIPIAVFFYCYENMKSEPGYQTLLVLRGTYSYTDSEKGKVSQDCYYTLAVNSPGHDVTFPDTDAKHELVRRNYIYNIGMILKGPGSSGPFDKEQSANLSATIKVKDWDTVENNEWVN